jgi:hypothetical protein
MRNLAFLLALVAVPPVPVTSTHAPFAIAVVGTTKTSTGIDQTITFDSAVTSGQHVLIMAVVYDQAGTLDLTDISVTEDIVINGDAHASQNLRLFAFCYAEDGSSDSTVILDSSHTTRAAAVVISGGSCTLDGSASSNDETGTQHNLTVDVTVTETTSFMMGFVASTSTADFTSAGFTPRPSDNSEIDGIAQGQYLVPTDPAGVYDVALFSAASETTIVGAFAVKAAGGGGGSAKVPAALLLRGVGGR